MSCHLTNHSIDRKWMGEWMDGQRKPILKWAGTASALPLPTPAPGKVG